MIEERLIRLYGPEIGRSAADRLRALLDRSRLDRPLRGDRFDQRSSVLITYGDTLLNPPDAPLSALERFAGRHLDGLISHIHLLPCFPYSSDYGFSVIDYDRIAPELGEWGDVERLGARFGLMLDFVLNHCSVESEWFRRFLRGEQPFDDFFVTADPAVDLSGVTRPRTTPLLTPFETANGTRHVWTTFSADQVDLNYANPDVLLAMIEVLLRYVGHGADLLRMDAVGYLWKRLGTSCIHLSETHEVVKLFRDVLDIAAPRTAIVTETNVPHADNISYFGDGHDEAQMVYQFPLAPLVLDGFARADARTLSTWAETLETPSDQTTFFNFLASHDGVGVVPARGILSDERVATLADRTIAHGGEVSYKSNPDGSASPYELNGTWFDLLSNPNGADSRATRLDRFICSQAIMLALAGVPGIYIHSVLGSHNDHEGYARSGWKRDLNHERLQLPMLLVNLADPDSHSARTFARYSRLLAVRRAQPAFHPSAPQRVLDVGPAVFALERGPRDGQTILALHNLADAVVDANVPTDRTFINLLTDQTVVPTRLRPYEVLWLMVDS
jgi:sucrose phosphorylase